MKLLRGTQDTKFIDSPDSGPGKKQENHHDEEIDSRQPADLPDSRIPRPVFMNHITHNLIKYDDKEKENSLPYRIYPWNLTGKDQGICKKA